MPLRNTESSRRFDNVCLLLYVQRYMRADWGVNERSSRGAVTTPLGLDHAP